MGCRGANPHQPVQGKCPLPCTKPRTPHTQGLFIFSPVLRAHSWQGWGSNPGPRPTLFLLDSPLHPPPAVSGGETEAQMCGARPSLERRLPGRGSRIPDLDSELGAGVGDPLEKRLEIVVQRGAPASTLDPQLASGFSFGALRPAPRGWALGAGHQLRGAERGSPGCPRRAMTPHLHPRAGHSGVGAPALGAALRRRTPFSSPRPALGCGPGSPRSPRSPRSWGPGTPRRPGPGRSGPGARGLPLAHLQRARGSGARGRGSGGARGSCLGGSGPLGSRSRNRRVRVSLPGPLRLARPGASGRRRRRSRLRARAGRGPFWDRGAQAGAGEAGVSRALLLSRGSRCRDWSLPWVSRDGGRKGLALD